MTEKRIDKNSVLIASIFILIIGIFGNIRSHIRPGLDPDVLGRISSLFFSTDGSNRTMGSGEPGGAAPYLKVDAVEVQREWELDFVIDFHSIGDTVLLSSNRAGFDNKRPAVLVKKYSGGGQFVLYVSLFLGIVFWAIGIYVYLNKSNDWAARVFYCASMAAALSTMILWPGNPQPNDLAGYFIVLVYWFFFPVTPAFVLYFTVLYPQTKSILRRRANLPGLIFKPVLLLAFILELGYFSALFTGKLEIYRYYYLTYNYGFRVLFFLYLLLSIASLIHTYVKSKGAENRNKIQWIFWGICIGLFPFLFLWTLPKIFGFPVLIPEILIYVFLMIIPVSFAFSIIRYQALDIEFIIRKSVYYLATALLFLLVLYIFASIAHRDIRAFLSLYRPYVNLALMLFILLFTPVFSRRFVKYYRQYLQPDRLYRSTIKEFNDALASRFHAQQIAALLLDRIDDLYKAEKIVLIGRQKSARSLKVYTSSGINPQEFEHRLARQSQSLLERKTVFNRTEFIEQSSRHTDEHPALVRRLASIIAGLREFIFSPHEPRYSESQRDFILAGLGMELIIPAVRQDQVIGWLLLDVKKSGERYSDRDVELLTQMATAVLTALETINLQQTMILERSKKEKLEEMNRLKSEFVSLVSHELRSPLTSISWSVENLLDGIPELPSPPIREYLTEINEHSRHLTRMIENLLNITRIEAGRIESDPEKLVLYDHIYEAVNMVKPRAEKKEIRIELDGGRGLTVYADSIHLKEILTNLLENAVKYSHDKGVIEITVRPPDAAGEYSAVSIRDYGVGIPVEKQRSIFDQFNRLNAAKNPGQRGLGLGLYIVKKLVEVQGGTIQVESEPDAGSLFTFTLPGVPDDLR